MSSIYMNGKKFAISGNQNTKRKYIFQSDSYEDNSKWIEQTVTRMGLSESDYTIASQSGSAFNDGSWLTLLTTAREAMTDSEANAVTDIVIGGGINDCQYENDSASGASEFFTKLYKAMQAYNDYVEEQFPNAIISYCFVGFAYENSSVLYGRNYKARKFCLGYIQQAMSDMTRFKYVSGTEYCLHNSNYMGSDLLHPNTTGGVVIARTIKNALLNGTADTHYCLRSAAGTLSSGSVSGTFAINEELDNNEIRLNMDMFTIMESTQTFTQSGIAIGTVDSQYFQRFDEIPVNLFIMCSDQSTIVQAVGAIYCENRTIYLRTYKLNDSSWSWREFASPYYVIVGEFVATVPTMES